MLDGVIFLDETGRLILGLPFNGDSSYSVDSVSALGLREAAQVPESGQFVELSHSQLVFERQYGRVRMHVPCSVTEAPAAVEGLASRIVTVIETYFGQSLSQNLLETNRSTVVLLLSEMFDAGVPRICEPDILKQLVPPSNIFKWLLTGSGPSSSRSAVDAAATGTHQAGLQSKLSEQQLLDDRVPWQLPWRRARVKHAKQELYVDIIENVSVLVASKSGQQRKAYSSHIIPTLPSRIQVSGKVAVLSKLNGPMPRASIELDGAGGFAGTRLHQCVDRAKWAESQGRTLSFTPPDGESIIATYKLVTGSPGPLLAELRREEDGTTEARLATLIDSKVSGINDLMVTVVYPPGTRTVKELSSTGGNFDVANPRRCTLRFEKSVPMGWQATLRAAAFTEHDEPVLPLYLELAFSLVGRVPSQTVVRGINISQSAQVGAQAAPTGPLQANTSAANEVKPFKGVRYQTITDNYIVK